MMRSICVILLLVACSKHDDKPAAEAAPKSAAADDGKAAARTPAPAKPDAAKPADAEPRDTPDDRAKAPPKHAVDPSETAPGPAYLGVEGTGLVRVDRGKAKTLVKHPYPIRDIAIGPKGVVFAVAIGGAWSIAGDKVTALPKLGSFTSFDKIAVGPDGVLWALDHNGVSRWDGKAWTNEPAKTFDAKLLRDIAVDRAGRVWVATPDYLWRLDGDRWNRLDVKLGGSKPFFESVLAGPSGEVYVTGFNGVLVYADDKWRDLKMQGKYSGGMRDVAVGVDGRLATSGGVDDVMIAAPGGAPKVVDLSAAGVKAHRAVVGAVDGTGRTWLETDNGVAILDASGKLLQQWEPGTVAGITGKIESLAVANGGPALPELTAAARGSVVGKVVSAGKPVGGAEVEICEQPLTMFQSTPCDSATVKRHTTTAADGTFKLADVTVGSYGFAIKPRAKWLVFIGGSSCCTALENGQTYDVGSITVDKVE
jgi:hypothetical protein